MIEEIGGRKVVLGLLILLVGVGVEIFGPKGLTENVLYLLIAVSSSYFLANVGVKFAGNNVDDLDIFEEGINLLNVKFEDNINRLQKLSNDVIDREGSLETDLELIDGRIEVIDKTLDSNHTDILKAVNANAANIDIVVDMLNQEEDEGISSAVDVLQGDVSLLLKAVRDSEAIAKDFNPKQMLQGIGNQNAAMSETMGYIGNGMAQLLAKVNARAKPQTGTVNE